MRQKGQRSLSLLQRLLGASTAVMMRIVNRGLEVYHLCGEEVSPYAPGAHFPFGSGNFCENAIGLNRFVGIDVSAWERGTEECGRFDFDWYCGLPLHSPPDPRRSLSARCCPGGAGMCCSARITP